MCSTEISACALAGDAGGEHVVARPQRQRRAAGQPREDRNVEDADGDDRVDRAGSEQRRDHDGEDQRGKREDEVVARA